MNDVRRFLRFTLPGIACILQLFLALLIAGDLKLGGFEVFSEKAGMAIGTVLGAFLLSGGLGYLLAQLYWGLYWFGPICKKVAIDHRPLLKELSAKFENNFKIVNIQKEDIIDRLSKRDAWIIVTYHFDAKLEAKKGMFEVQNMSNRLMDVTHSLGATLMGSVLAIIAWILIHGQRIITNNTCLKLQDCLVPIGWIIVILIMQSAYKSSLNAHEKLADTKFANDVIKKLKSGKSFSIFYPHPEGPKNMPHSQKSD